MIKTTAYAIAMVAAMATSSAVYAQTDPDLRVCGYAGCIAKQQQAAHLSNYVPRPQGWFVLMPPLTKADPVLGMRYVDEKAPMYRWDAVVVRGHDGHDYDFPDEQTCLAWLAMLVLEPSEHGLDSFGAGWMGSGKCLADDNRRKVINQRTLERTLGRFRSVD